MANDNNIGKKGGPQSATGKLADAVESVVTPKKDNVFARHGNQQISEAIQQAQSQQKQAPSLLNSLDAESEQAAQKAPSWAENEKAAAGKDEEEATIAKKAEPEEVQAKKDAPEKPKKVLSSAVAATLTESTQPEQKVSDEKLAKLAPKGSEAEALIAGADQEQLEEVERVQKEKPGVLSAEDVVLAMATAQGLDEEKKADLLLARNKQVDPKSLANESGELRSLIMAEQLPPELAPFARDAAREASDTPLSERDTIKNVKDRINIIAQQIGNYPQLTDPKASVEEKSTRLVELLAYELDVPTRQSVAVHSFEALVDDMIFDPQGLMEVNRIAGNRRDVRTIGSFGVILWQCAYEAVQGRLESLDVKKQINEKDFLADIYRQMATDMYTDAMAKPSGV